jgi:phosphopantetheinyl transferase
LKAVTFLFDRNQEASEGASVWILDLNVEKTPPFDPFGQGIVRGILTRNLGLGPEQIVLTRNAFGRPVLWEGHGEAGDFNVAHSKNILVVGLVRGGKIGVDVEVVGPVQGIDLAAVGRDNFTEGEQKWIESFGEGERLLPFFRVWTAKEAMAKAVGVGLSFPLSKIETASCDQGTKILNPPGWELVQKEVVIGGNSALVAVCVGD